MFNTYLSRLKCYRKFARKSLVFLLTFSLLVSQFSFLIPSVYAASSPWSQTDWSGGSGQTSWSDNTKFDSSSNVNETTSGQLTLSVNPYTTRVLAYSPIAYWPMNEASGTVAEDATTNNRDGAYTGVDLGQTGVGDGNTAPWFDGTNDYNNIYSTSLRDAFNGSEGTIALWAKVNSAEVWTNGVSNNPVWIRVDDNNYIRIGKPVVNNTLYWIYKAGGTQKTGSSTAYALTTWLHLAITWSKSADQVKAYANGVQVGATLTGLGVWAGTLASNLTLIGAGSITTIVWHGWLAHGAVWDTPLSSTQIADLAVVEKYQSSGTVTSSIFDTGQSTNWGTLTYNATTPTNTSASVKVRTSNSSSMTGATDFGSCIAISSSSDMSTNSCVTDTHRYIQYQATLSTTDTTATPTFEDISLAFTASDSTPPSISLTAVSPDPNNDNTPALTGTATEAIGTVSAVQFQMDSTAGSWSSCTADDGTFDEATETFSCTVSTALSDGSHTMYIRATDSNSNTTTSGSESSDTFTIDATAPTSIDLDSPGDNSYTSSERPTFKWKATSDATAGLWKFTLEIDNPSIGSNQPSGDFTIDSIPTSRTTDYETNKYYIHYENFSDSDSNNNYISVYTKSHNGWSSSENDGKLREGKVSWKVKAVDNAGNETTSSRTLFVDRTGPTVEFTQVNDLPSTSKESSSATLEVFFTLSTTDKTPTIYGKITDSLAGGDSSLTQDENGPKVASGPKSVEIKIEKQENLTYKTHTLYTINLDKPYYTCDNKELSDNSKQKCDKYLPFEYTPGQELDLGTYKITVTGKDKAGNTSSDTKFTLNITTLAQITTPEEEQLIEEVLKELPKELQEEVLKRLEITKVEESKPPSALEETVEKVATGGKSVFDSVTSLVGGFVGNIAGGINHGIQQVFNTANAAGQEAKLVFNTVSQVLITISDKTGEAIISLNQKIGEETKTLEERYDHLTNNASGITKIILTKIGNGVSATGSAIASTTNRAILTTATLAQEAGLAMANTVQSAANKVKNRVANIAFTIGEKTQGVTGDFSLALIRFAYNFVPEPTKISDVQILILSPSSAKVSWKTNHPANGKVNWGLTADYGQDVQSEKRVTYHEFTINNLEPNTTYYYEVMSHNKNYVYDANHTFTTPK